MQLQFEKQEISCLHTVKRELQSQEQTQEVRISDGMPDIGSIIGCSGQVILRSKEWQGDGMTVTGGTMVWVQYLPEDDDIPQCVESWLPFQMRWTFPQTRQDGVILVQSILGNVDARILSSRKLMFRANVSVLGWAMEKGTQDCYYPVQIPEDVHLRRESYPMELPVEAGEKAFQLEEILPLPPTLPGVETVTGYTLQPVITEEKMMGDKVVFRGKGMLHLSYSAQDGSRLSWDYDLPFTQYSELDAEYGDDASVLLWPSVTSLEIDRDGEQLAVKAGLVCQYRISNRQIVDVVSDAYSPRRTVEGNLQELKLPGILERKNQTIHVQKNTPLEGTQMVDIRFLPQPVQINRQNGMAELELSGRFQMLYHDIDGKLRATSQNWEEKLPIPLGEETVMEADLWPAGIAQGAIMSGSANLSTELKLVSEAMNGGSIPMITALELGELQQPDSRRPSLILRRSGGEDLWELAKSHGSSVESIRSANNLVGEPDGTQMLLIPIL